MALIRRALVIGEGFAGMTAALRLDSPCVAVNLREIAAVWRPFGAGPVHDQARKNPQRSLTALALARQCPGSKVIQP